MNKKLQSHLPLAAMAIAGCLILSCDPGIQSQQIFSVEADAIRLTNDSRSKNHLAWSPDGRMIAYTQRETGTRFFSLSIADTNAERLLDEDDGFSDPKLSPDGRTIAYVSRTGYVWLYSLQDGSKRLLTQEYRYVSGPIWSPDGRWIAFNYADRTLAGIAIVPVEGGVARKILEGERAYYYCYSFSPDGEKIALYSRRGGNYEITTVDVNNGELQQLTSPPYEKLFPAWSPDGATIAYVAYEDSCSARSSTIWLLSLAGGQPRELATFPEIITQLLWSPDGASLVTLSTSYPGGLFLVSLADGSAKILTEQREKTPGWFPDGQTLLTTRTLQSSTIRAVSLEEKQPRLISDQKIDTAFHPAWLNDTEVAFIRRNATSRNAVWKISTAGGRSVQLPLDSTSVKESIALSPDRAQMLFDDGYDDIYLQAVAGGTLTNLTAHTSEVLSEPSWSPDGKQIVCRHSSGLKVFALVSNKLVERKFFPGFYYEPAWSPDATFGSPIAFYNDGSIYTVSLDDSEPKFAIQYAYSPAWSPDGRRLAYIRAQDIFINTVFGEIK